MLMNSITIDFSSCKHLAEIYGVIKQQFDIPSYYGENLSALWDLLTGYIETPVIIYVKGISMLPDELRSYMPRILAIFERAEEQYGEIRCIVEE